MRVCSKCGESKSEDKFNWRKKGVRRATQCKSCHSAYRRQHYLDNREKYITKVEERRVRLGGHRGVKYNLSPAEWEDMLALHDGKCYICRMREAEVVDHDHNCCPKETTCGNCVRGALCRGCNTAIGIFKDSPVILQHAIAYLEGAVRVP